MQSLQRHQINQSYHIHNNTKLYRCPTNITWCWILTLGTICHAWILLRWAGYHHLANNKKILGLETKGRRKLCKNTPIGEYCSCIRAQHGLTAFVTSMYDFWANKIGRQILTQTWHWVLFLSERLYLQRENQFKISALQSEWRSTIANL